MRRDPAPRPGDGSARRAAWASLGLVVVLFAGGVSLVLGQGACAETDPEAPCACDGSGSRIVDPVLLAFLSKARAAHHQADVSEASGRKGDAATVLEALVAGPRPPGETTPEVAEVLADTSARLADLRSASGDFDEAMRRVESGLALARDVSHFRGHLLEVRGVVEERRAASLEKAGDAAGARAARERAIASFQQAIEVQDHVIRRSLDAGGR